MKTAKLKTIVFELLLILILLFALFIPNIFTRQVLAVILCIYAVTVHRFLKKRKTASIDENSVTVCMIFFAIIYIAIFYLLGLYFGFVKAKVQFSLWSIGRFMIPLSVIIIVSEWMRMIFLSQELMLRIQALKLNVSPVLTYIAMVLVDLVIYTGIYDLTNLEDMLIAIGFVLFASLSCNLLYNHLSSRYGCTGIIIYRILTTLYVYFIPISPDIFLFFQSFIRMLYPYIVYLIIDKWFSKYEFVVAYKEKRREVISNAVLLVVACLYIMLISCQFRYGILVVGSGSMTGSIDMGDAVIYERYDEQVIQEKEVIIFAYNGIQTIHRVTNIKFVNGELRYYTQGDANPTPDTGYRTDADILGIVKLRVRYFGYPTLWLRDLFVD